MKLLDSIRRGRTYVIAEMSANHGGSLGTALELVRAAKASGADCLKTQTYTADTMTIDCDAPYFRVSGGLWDGMTLYGLYRKACTPWEWQQPVKKECERLHMDFLSTPFDRTAVDFLESLGAEAYKIASPELIDLPLIRYAAAKGKPIILSCGMAAPEEIREALDAVRSRGCGDCILLKCCSEYPSKPEDMNLSVIPEMKRAFRCPVGLSDHSAGILAAAVGVSLGACVVEKHLCLSRKIPTPDSAFSMEPDEFKAMVGEIREVERIRGRPFCGASEGEKRGLRNRRSLFAVRDIRAGEKLTEQNIRSIRPGQGLPPKYWERVLGGTAKRDIARGTPLSLELIDREVTK